jgi:hypothetical protein
VKTGRLLKLEREGVSIQVYFYREGGAMQASVFVLESGRSPAAEPLARFSAASDPELERIVRGFVDERWPRRG